MGSGKTSLLNAILGEINLIPDPNGNESKLFNQQKMHYISQRPWILNASIKENIILDKTYNKSLLQQALEFSALDKDLANFPKGMDQEVGEKGAIISGGQKGRIAIARLIYQQ